MSIEVPVGSADMDAVLYVVTQALAKVGPAPETVIAADPRTVAVDWEARVEAARRDKMRVILTETRVWLDTVHVLARLPQVLLVADDGTAIELYGNGGRLGVTDGNQGPGDVNAPLQLARAAEDGHVPPR